MKECKERKEIELEYIYVTIPAEYICVYHRILAMMADYGEEMLKDCKASCTDRNNNVIECFNMFNSAVAARKLGKEKLAETLICYIKAKINQIYKGKDNSTDFVFPVDEHGQLKAFVSCGERPKFEIDPDDMYLYEHKFNNGFNEHFALGQEDFSDYDDEFANTTGLKAKLIPSYHSDHHGHDHPCINIVVYYDGVLVQPKELDVLDFYFDDRQIYKFENIHNIRPGKHKFTAVIKYKGETLVLEEYLKYEIGRRSFR